MILEKLVFFIIPLGFLLHFMPFVKKDPYQKILPGLGLLANLSIGGLILEKFLELGERKVEILYLWKFLSLPNINLDVAFILDEISLGFGFLILSLSCLFYIFILLKWDYFKKNYTSFNFSIFYLGVIISLFSIFSENIFMLFFLWLFMGIIIFIYARPYYLFNKEKNLRTIFILEGLSFSLFVITILIFLICFNGSLSFLNFKGINFSFIEAKQVALTVAIIFFIMALTFRIIFPPFNFWNKENGKLEKYKYGFLYDILTSFVILSVLTRLNPIFIFLPSVHLFLQILGTVIFLMSSLFLFFEKKGDKNLLLLNSCFWGFGLFCAGLGFWGDALYFLIGFLLLKNFLLLIDWEISLINSGGGNPKIKFLKGLFVLIYLIICGFPGGVTSFFIPEISWKIFSNNSIGVYIYLIFNTVWFISMVSIFGSMMKRLDMDEKSLKFVIKIPKNIIQLKVKEYLPHLILFGGVIIFFYKGHALKEKFNFSPKFSLPILNQYQTLQGTFGDESKFYFFAIYLVLFSLAIWLSYFIFLKPSKKLVDFHFKTINHKERFLLYFNIPNLSRIYFRPIIIFIGFLIKQTYQFIFLKLIIKMPLKLTHQIGIYFNSKKSDSLLDGLILSFFGIAIFLYFIFSKINTVS